MLPITRIESTSYFKTLHDARRTRMDVDSSSHVKRAHSHNGPTSIIRNVPSVSDDPRLRYHPNLKPITPPFRLFHPALEYSRKSYDIGRRDSDRNADYVDIMPCVIPIMVWGTPIVIRA
ncbi:hypothetical protein PENSUB_12837 [Penicillium subrubescens]|uniref:Uncharacterized protein n=1 Tax=Penicillium subrubescens TaxID=1316194 RepID=A0A1Q5SWP2_9EURO|nr:hypothetical protein PENSUB_12837 [Penicillium subrubescens]